MSVDQSFRSPPEPPPELPAVAAPSRKPFPGMWGAITLCVIFLASQMFGGIALAVVSVAIGGMQAANDLMMLGLGPINIAAFALTMFVGLLWGGLGTWDGFGAAAPFMFGAATALLAAVLMVTWFPRTLSDAVQ